MAEANLIVTRHSGLVDWLRQHGIDGEVVEHVTDAGQVRGRVVYGVLPMDLAAECDSVFNVDLPGLPADRRGVNLNAQEMDSYGAQLTGYVVRKNPARVDVPVVAQPRPSLSGADPVLAFDSQFTENAPKFAPVASHPASHLHSVKFPRGFVIISTLLLIVASWLIGALCNGVHQVIWRISDAFASGAAAAVTQPKADVPLLDITVSAFLSLLFALIMFRLWLYAFHRRIKHRPVFWLNLMALLAAGILANECANLFKLAFPGPWWSLGIGILVVVVLFALVNYFRERIEMVVTPVAHDADAYAEKNPVEGLILLVSTHQDRHSVKVAGHGSDLGVEVNANNCGVKLMLKPNNDPVRIEKHITALQPAKINWQQLLRALRPHVIHDQAKHIKKIYLVGSADSEVMKNGEPTLVPGSVHLLGDCKRWLGSYLPEQNDRGKPMVEYLPEGIDFESVHALAEALRKAVRLLKKQGCREEHILIDVTGGQKTSSVAGAAVTIGRPGLFQYVSTLGDCKASVYDMIWAQPPG